MNESKPVVTGEQVRMTREHEELILRILAGRFWLKAPAAHLGEIQSLVASIVSGDTVCVPRKELDRLYWVLVDPVAHAQAIEVEQAQGKHESVFDAIDACMVREKKRRMLATPATQEEP